MPDFLNSVEIQKAILDNKHKLTAGWVYAADCLHWKEFPNYMHYTKSDLTEAHNDISFDVSFRAKNKYIRNDTLIEQHQRVLLWPKVTNKTTINFPKGDMTFLEKTLSHSDTQVEFQYTSSVSLGKRISLDWDIWVLMADSEYNHDETKLWLEKVNTSVFHSDQFGPSIDVIFTIGTTTHVIPAAVGETTLHDTHGVPICLWLVDTNYDPRMHVGGQAGTSAEFFSAIHKQITKLTNDVTKLQPLTSLTATQIEFIRKFDAQLFTGQLQMVLNKIQALQEIRISVSGEVTTTVKQQGPSFWEKLLGGLAGAATGALGAALVTSIQSAGELRKSVTEAAANTVNDIAKSATGGAFKTIGNALSKFQTVSQLLERKLTALQNQVLGKFQTLDHITQTIDTVKNWVDPSGDKKPIDRRLIDNTTKIETLEKQMTTATDISEMREFLTNIKKRMTVKGFKGITECMDDLWKEVEIIDTSKLLLINTRHRVLQLEKEIKKAQYLKSILDTTISVVQRLEQRIEAVKNLYGDGGLRVVYNSGDIFPYPL